MEDFDFFDEEQEVREYDQELLDRFYEKEGIRLTNEYSKVFPPEIEKQFMILLEKNYNKPLKVIRGIERLVDKYPDSIEVKYQLFSLYEGAKNYKGAKKVLMRMVEEHPEDILGVSLLMDGLLEPEELKKYEYLLGEGREASSFFGVDKEIYAGEYCDYQMAACHYEAFTGDFVRAKNRVRTLLDIGYEREEEDIYEMMRKIAGCMVYTIMKRQEEMYKGISTMSEENKKQEPEIIDDRVESLLEEHIAEVMIEMKEKQERIELGLEDEDYWEDEDDEYPYIEPVEQVVRDSPKVGRNDPCPCGSGRKYKKCCL